MLTAFFRAFRTPDLRKKLLFTLGIIALFRFGSSCRPRVIPREHPVVCPGEARTAGNVYRS